MRNKKLFVFFGLLIFFCSSTVVPLFGAQDKVVAVIRSRDIEPYQSALRGFVQVLERDGFDSRITVYDMEADKEKGRGICKEIKAERPDVVLVLGSIALEVAASEIKDIPIVFSMVLDPVSGGFIESMKSSGNNLTGACLDIPIELQFETMKSALPSLKRIGTLYTKKNTGVLVKKAQRVAEQMGLKLAAVELTSAKDLPEALESLAWRIDFFWMAPDSTIYIPQSVEHLLLYSLRNKLPVMGLSSSYVKAGSLLALSCDFEDIGQQSGEIAVRILAGEKPSEIPISAPRKCFLSMNLITAKKIEIEIHSDLLKQAKDVFGK